MSLFVQMESRWAADRPAVTYQDETWTFGRLSEEVRASAQWLHDQGLRKGDVLALQLPRHRSLLVLHLAALSQGIVTLPMHPGLTAPETAYVLDDAGAKLHLTEPPTLPPGRLDPRDDIDADDVAVLMYTSGTTGRAKGALLSHANIGAMVRALHEAWHWSDADVLVHVLPLFHVHGLFVAQHGALWAGAHAVWLERFEPAAVFAAIARWKATVFMAVPTHYHRLLAHPDAVDVSSMRLFTSGSAPLPAAEHRAFRERFGHAILERYGMTEIGIVLSNPYEGERRPGAVGFPLPGVEARVRDGEVQIRGPSVFRGYLGRGSPLLDGGWMPTGDLGSIDDDGYIHLQGRRGDMIISGGENVYPREIEAALCAHDTVREAAVVGIPDADLGERVVAAVVGERADIDVRGVLAPHKRPKEIRWMRELPRNAMGKVQRHVLRKQWPVVRDAVPADLDLLVEGNARMALETEDLTLDVERLRRGVQRVFSEDVGARYLVCERDGAPAGQLMLTLEWSDWRDAEVWWIQSVYVWPEHRGHGVYRALHDHVVRTARKAGAAGVRLYVDRRNTRAAGVYRSVGMDGEHYLVYEQMFP